jgi:hypothetical protein
MSQMSILTSNFIYATPGVQELSTAFPEISLHPFTHWLYSCLFSRYIVAASALAGELGLGSESSDRTNVSTAETS